MKKKVLTLSKKTSRKWAYQTFALAICLSLIFGFLSQTILSSMGIIVSVIGICFFIFISVVFDMIGIAIASSDEDVLKKWEKEGIKGSKTAVKLWENSEKVCSFCADVVGDICSTLCGAGGACIVVSISNYFQGEKTFMLLSISVSAIVAGATIFFKALMKSKAINNANEIILKLACMIEKFKLKKKKNIK